MDLREQALHLALRANKEETTKWNQYKNELESAKNNINEFVKHIKVQVMIPLGSKAIMPGCLYHTNEILTSHYQGYFSNISANQAVDLIKMRINKADEKLKAFHAEYDLYHDKLELPFSDVLNSGQEIIEPYNEAEENAWRMKHKESVRKMKEQEVRARSNIPDSKENILDILDVLELQEEVYGEFDLDDVNGEENDSNYLENGTVFENKKLEHQEENKKSEEESDTDDDVPEEFKDILKNCESLSPEEKMCFLKNKLENLNASMQEKKLVSPDDLLQRVKECELKSLLEEILEEEYSSESDSSISENSNYNTRSNTESCKKKQIRFSDDIHVEYIDKNAPVTNIFKSNTTPDCIKIPKSVKSYQSNKKQYNIPPKINAQINYPTTETYFIEYNHSNDQYSPDFSDNSISSPLEILLKYNVSSKKIKNSKSSIKEDTKYMEIVSCIDPSQPLKSILKTSNSVDQINSINIGDNITAYNISSNNSLPNIESQYTLSSADFENVRILPNLILCVIFN